MIFHAKTPINLVRFQNETAYGIEQKGDVFKMMENLPIRSSVLDVGCGFGIPTTFLKTYGFQVFSCDIQNKNTETIKEIMWSMDIPFKVSETNKLPYSSEMFDAVMLYAVYEHIKPGNKEALISECRRVLKSEGKLFIFRAINRFSFSEWLARKMKLPHHAEDVVTQRDSLEIFKSAGLEIIESGMQGWIPENIRFLDKWTVYVINKFLCRLPIVKKLGHSFWWILKK